MSENLFIGTDIGGSAVKAIVFNETGDIVTSGHAAFRPSSPQYGWEEKDMNEVWNALKSILKDISKNLKDRVKNIRAIGVTAAGFGAWFIDKDGNPVRPAVAYQDIRAVDIVRKWEEDKTSELFFNVTGSALTSGMTVAYVKWFAENDPLVLKKASYVLDAQGWLHFKLTGIASTDESGATILAADLENFEYNDELLKALGLFEYKYLFPPVKTAFSPTGPILSDLAKEIGFPETVLVVNAPTDMNTCMVGSGILDEGDVYSNGGTAHGNNFITKEKEIEKTVNSQIVPIDFPDRKYVHATFPYYGAVNQDWFIDEFLSEEKKNLKKDDISVYEHIAKKVKDIPAGSNGIIFHPFKDGFGDLLPYINKNESTFFLGLTPFHTKYDLLNAIYEGDALASRRILEKVKVKPKNIILSGGLSASEKWCQIYADMFGVPAKVSAGEEATPLGAVIHAAYAIGFFDSLRDAMNNMVKYSKIYTPNKKNHEFYNKLYRIYEKLYDNLEQSWNDLKKLA
ncbi:xylulokinase [Acetitomaculum ruminis DSM 5522]|uniref:Xylulokinase n=1 Tax=Acetitomaculum ruminis DSM 5522 TaxID=1120918 RepID=A0A1I1A213_9FIRM|nr:FGGY family carbohydrate kinase [Acetitomaculum ruminis]SFB32034.1 xylulokinase [Acetitomaculum ruminis DSM 5522]